MKHLSLLKNKDLSDKICLLRVDLNIEDEELRDTHPRIRAILPTIKFLIQRGAKVAILSHRGKPKESDKRQAASGNFSLKPFAKILSKLLNQPVDFMDFKNGFNPALVHRNIAMTRHSIFLLENLRFLPGEEKDDGKFAAKLASLGDFYVNDDFGVSHRKDASVVAITKYLPSYAGLLLEKEIANLDKIIKKPKRPLVVILGGAKVADKIGLIKELVKKADRFLIGGAAANTFFAAENLPVGESLYEKEMVPTARRLLKSGKIILPFDLAVKKRKILDIGPETAKRYGDIIKKAGTVIWNGPMGYFENPRFAKGSKAIARAIAKSKAFGVVGGGETTSLVPNVKGQKSNVFLSTGGGAMLEYLAGKTLPGIKALK